MDTGSVARRLRREVADLYGYTSEFHVLASGGLRKEPLHRRVVRDGEALARQTGLLDVRGRPVRDSLRMWSPAGSAARWRRGGVPSSPTGR